MGCCCVRACLRYAPHHYMEASQARQWCARSIIPYYTFRFRAGRTCSSCRTSDLFCRTACEVSVCLLRIAAMHSALVSAIVSSTVSRSLKPEWIIADNARQFGKKLFVNLWIIELDSDLSSAKSNFYFRRTRCAIWSVKVNFSSVLTRNNFLYDFFTAKKKFLRTFCL